MIKKFSHLHKAEKDYSSASYLLKDLPSLCMSASATEFKTELEKYKESIGMTLYGILSAKDETSPLQNPFYIACLYGHDSIRKWDYILSQILPGSMWTWLDSPNPAMPSETMLQYVLSHPDLKAVFEKHDYVFTQLEGYGVKHDTFEWNGFSILNAGFDHENMTRVLQQLQPTVEKIKKHGFGNILYNPIVFVSSPMQGQVYNVYQKQYQKQPTGAYYSVTNDHIVIKATNWDTGRTYNATFAHELAHRQYYKFLSSSQRQRWEQHFRDRAKTIAPEVIDTLKQIILSSLEKQFVDPLTGQTWDDFRSLNFRTFSSLLKKNPGVKESFDFILEYFAIQTGLKSEHLPYLRRKWYENVLEIGALGGLERSCKNLPLLAKALVTKEVSQETKNAARWTTPDADRVYYYKEKGLDPFLANIEAEYDVCKASLRRWSLTRFLGGMKGFTIKLPHSTSEYGKNNPEEDYAEAFEAFIHNKEMPVDIYREFVALNQIRLGSKKTAKLSPAEEMRIDALQKRIDSLYRKKHFDEAEELEESLEILLNDLESREEHFDTESDESEDFYGYENRLTKNKSLVPDLDDEGNQPSLEAELAKLYFEWNTEQYTSRDFSDTDAIKDFLNNNPGTAYKDVPPEIDKSEKIFVGIFKSMLDEYGWDDKPRKEEDIPFEEALAAAKDAYESVTKRRDRTRELLKKQSTDKKAKWQKVDGEMDYKPEHDFDTALFEYDIIYDAYLDSFVEENKEKILKRIEHKYGELPFSDFEVCAVTPGSLENDAARYLFGTYSNPRIVIDMDLHGVSESEIFASILHELSHAIQDSREEDMDEDDAESDVYDI